MIDISLLADLLGQIKDFSDFLTSDSKIKLGIIIVGLVKPKKEDI